MAKDCRMYDRVDYQRHYPNIESSLQDRRTSFKMTLPTKIICHFLRYLGPIVNVTNSITMGI